MVDYRISFVYGRLKNVRKRLFYSKNEFMVDSRIVSLESTIDFFRELFLDTVP